MLLSAASVLVVAQSSLEIPEGLMNNPVYNVDCASLSYWKNNLTKTPVTDISVLTTHTKLQKHDN